MGILTKSLRNEIKQNPGNFYLTFDIYDLLFDWSYNKQTKLIYFISSSGLFISVDRQSERLLCRLIIYWYHITLSSYASTTGRTKTSHDTAKKDPALSPHSRRYPHRSWIAQPKMVDTSLKSEPLMPVHTLSARGTESNQAKQGYLHCFLENLRTWWTV